MPRTPFRVEVLTPEGEVFNDEVEMVSTKTTVGSIGLLANHQPLLAMLDPTELRLYKSESDVVRFAQGEGFLQVAGTHALVLVDEAFAIEDLDTADIKSRLDRAEQELSSAEEGTEERRAAERDKRRYEAFLGISEGASSRSAAGPDLRPARSGSPTASSSRTNASAAAWAPSVRRRQASLTAIRPARVPAASSPSRPSGSSGRDGSSRRAP